MFGINQVILIHQLPIRILIIKEITQRPKRRNHLFENNSKENSLKLRNVNYYKLDKANNFEFGFESIYNFSNFDVLYEPWEDNYGNITPRLYVNKNMSTMKGGVFAQHRLNYFRETKFRIWGQTRLF